MKEKCLRGHDRIPENLYSKSTCKMCHALLKSTGKPPGREPLPTGIASFNKLYLSYRYGARKRHLPFILSKEEFKALTQLPCAYCGIEPSQIYKASMGHNKCSSIYVYNGVDRVNNLVGYIPSNVVPCCKQCNQAKLSTTIEEFLAWVKRLVAFQNRESGAPDLKHRKELTQCLPT